MVILTAIPVAESAGGLAKSISFPDVDKDWRGTACTEKNRLPGLPLYFERLLLLFTIVPVMCINRDYLLLHKEENQK